jgi:predicted phage tail protein
MDRPWGGRRGGWIVTVKNLWIILGAIWIIASIAALAGGLHVVLYFMVNAVLGFAYSCIKQDILIRDDMYREMYGHDGTD